MIAPCLKYDQYDATCRCGWAIRHIEGAATAQRWADDHGRYLALLEKPRHHAHIIKRDLLFPEPYDSNRGDQ